MKTAAIITESLRQSIRRAATEAGSLREVGDAMLVALDRAHVDLRRVPLEEAKAALSDALRHAHLKP